MTEFTEATHALAPWSVSKAKLVRTCPLAFHYKYREKRPEPPSLITRVGVGAHAVLEHVERGEPVPDALAHAVAEHGLSEPEIAGMQRFLGGIERFADTLVRFRADTPIHRELCEEKLGLRADLVPTKFFADDVFFRGAWDLGFVLADQRVALIDHKTARKKALRWYAEQLRCYAIMALAHFPALRKVCSAVHFIGDAEVVWAPAHSAEEIRDRLRAWFVGWLNDSADRASRPDPQPVVSKFCSFCGYRPICPAHTLEVAGERLVALSTRRALHGLGS